MQTWPHHATETERNGRVLALEQYSCSQIPQPEAGHLRLTVRNQTEQGSGCKEKAQAKARSFRCGCRDRTSNIEQGCATIRRAQIDRPIEVVAALEHSICDIKIAILVQYGRSAGIGCYSRDVGDNVEIVQPQLGCTPAHTHRQLHKVLFHFYDTCVGRNFFVECKLGHGRALTGKLLTISLQQAVDISNRTSSGGTFIIHPRNSRMRRSCTDGVVTMA